jgi:flagellar motor switch protein FliG
MSASSTASTPGISPDAQPLDFEKFSRAKKLAIFLVTIGPESAAELMKHFDDNTVEAITKEVTQLGLIPVEHQRAAIQEFSSVILESTKGVLGGSPYAQRTLELAKGDFKAVVDTTLPMSELVRAHEMVDSRTHFGKVVLVN